MENDYPAPPNENSGDQQNGGDQQANGGDGVPPVADAPRQIMIGFRDGRGFEQQFKLKTTTRMQKAMDAFSAKVERPRTQLRFLIDGDRVLDDQTPADLELQDGDVIECHEEQIGGGEKGGD